MSVAALVACGSACTAFGKARLLGETATAHAKLAAVQQFVAEADQLCTEFLGARWAVGLVAFGADPAIPPTRELRYAFYQELLTAAETHLRDLSALDAPAPTQPLASQLIADAYATWLLVAEVLAAHARGDQTVTAKAEARLDTHLNHTTSPNRELRAYGFGVCNTGPGNAP